ncbi:MAG: hypothetical protein HZB16_14170 [Armatimonadetes bacterium]|nr:hypothetical protein [Armatimonadota bacterium]
MARLTTARIDGLLLVWFSLHLVYAVQPYLIYQAQQPPFACTRGFAADLLGYSGGPVRYVGLFLAQLDAFNAAGVLVRVVIALLIGVLTSALFQRLAGGRARAARLLPVVLYMLLAARYDQPLLLGPMLVAMLASALIFASGPTGLGRYLVLLAALIYGVAGAAGPATTYLLVLAFGALCGALSGSSRRLALAVYPALGVAAVSLADLLGLQALPAQWRYGIAPGRLTVDLAVSLWLLYAVAAIAAVYVADPLRARCHAWRAARAGAAPSSGGRRVRRLLGEVALVALVAVLAATVAADKAGRQRARMDFLALHGQWGQLLAELERGGPRHELAPFDVNRALFAQGRLGEAMFQVPQRADALLLSVETTYVLATRIRMVDQWLDLGRLNLAEYALHNAWVLGDDNPVVLSRLAQLYMVKGMSSAARTYLRTLSDNLVWRRWAQRELHRLAVDPTLASSPEVLRRRAVMLRGDDLLHINRYADKAEERAWHLVPEILSSLLRENPRNRMALDYLIAHFLLEGHPEYAALEMHRLRDCGVTELPRAWAEAALLGRDLLPTPPDLASLTIPESAQERYWQFRTIVKRNRGSMAAAYPELQREMSGTYFLYLVRLGLGR